jgi:hypothetical protein
MLADVLMFNMQPRASKYQYREAFKIDSNLAIYAVALVFLAVLASLWAFFNNVEQNNKGLWFKLGFAGSSALAAVFCLFTLYKTTDDIDFVNSVVEKISDNTGILKETVRKKKLEREQIQIADTKVKESITKIVEREIDSIPDSLIVEVDTVKSKEEPVKKSFASIVSGGSKANIKKPIEEVVEEEPERKSAFASMVGGDGNKSSFPSGSTNDRNSSSRKTLFVKIIGTQSVSNNSSINLRLVDQIEIKGRRYPANHVFKATVIRMNNNVQVKFNINGLNGYLVDEGNNDKLSRKAYRLNKDELILSSSEKIKGFII